MNIFTRLQTIQNSVIMDGRTDLFGQWVAKADIVNIQADIGQASPFTPSLTDSEAAQQANGCPTGPDAGCSSEHS
jgi:hypothetical protein